MGERNEWIRSKATELGTIDGVEYWITPHRESLNGYVCFPQKPVKESGYDGILRYVPVHGGITYVEHDQAGSIYGFDTMHYNSSEFPINDPQWIRGQCELMIRAIKLAATLEDEYLLAEGDNDKRAALCQKLVDLNPKDWWNFGLGINLLAGKL